MREVIHSDMISPGFTPSSFYRFRTGSTAELFTHHTARFEPSDASPASHFEERIRDDDSPIVKLRVKSCRSESDD